MKKPLATLALAAVLAGCATPYAPQEFDFSELGGVGNLAAGIVESVREVQLETGFQAFADALEHPMQPEVGDELLVRLDDGRTVTVNQKGMQRFEPGQRVRVVSDAHGARLEHE